MMKYEHSTFQENAITFLLGLTLFVLNLEYSAFNLLIKPLSSQFDLPITAMQWLVTSYMVCWGLSLFFIGCIADIWGKKRIFLIGTLLFSLAAFLAAASFNFIWIIVARSIQGIAAAMLSATSITLLFSHIRQQRKYLLLAWAIAGFAAGQTLGPFIGALILRTYWKIIFWLCIPCMLSVMLGINYLIPEDKKEVYESFDLKGTVFISIASFFSIISFIQFPFLEASLFSKILFFAVSVGFFTIYIKHSKQHENPIMPISCLNNKTYLIASILRLVFNFIYTGFFFVLALLLQSYFQLSSLHAGIVLGMLTIIMTIASPVGGNLARQHHPIKIICLGFFLIALGFLFFSYIHSIQFMIGFASCIAIGFGFCNANITALLLKNIEPQYITRAYSFNTMFVIFASSLSIYFASNDKAIFFL